MRDFIIFFEEKKGTSPLVRLLDNYCGISVVHQTENRGWEPFDRTTAMNPAADSRRRSAGRKRHGRLIPARGHAAVRVAGCCPRTRSALAGLLPQATGPAPAEEKPEARSG